MNKKFMIFMIALMGVSLFNVSYGMFARLRDYSDLNSGLKGHEGSPKTSVLQSPSTIMSDVAVKTIATDQLNQSLVARSIYNQPLNFVKKTVEPEMVQQNSQVSSVENQEVISNFNQQLYRNNPKFTKFKSSSSSTAPIILRNTPNEISARQSLETFPSNKPVDSLQLHKGDQQSFVGAMKLPDEIVELSIQPKTQKNLDFTGKENVEKSVMSERPVNKGLFAGLGGARLKKVDKSQKQYTKKEYDDALKQVVKDAKINAINGIKRQANQLFEQEWPTILETFEKDHQQAGVSIDQDVINGLKKQRKDMLESNAIDENQAKIEQYQKQAEIDFKKKTPEPQASAIVSAGKIESEGVVRSEAVRNARNSILEKKVDILFTPKYQEVWKQDYILKSYPRKVSEAEINENLKTHYIQLRSQQYKNLTPEDIIFEKQAGDRAVLLSKMSPEGKNQAAQQFGVDEVYRPSLNMQFKGDSSSVGAIVKVQPNITENNKQFFAKSNPLRKSSSLIEVVKPISDSLVTESSLVSLSPDVAS